MLLLEYLELNLHRRLTVELLARIGGGLVVTGGRRRSSESRSHFVVLVCFSKGLV